MKSEEFLLKAGQELFTDMHGPTINLLPQLAQVLSLRMSLPCLASIRKYCQPARPRNSQPLVG
jgi:hypothetical protein